MAKPTATLLNLTCRASYLLYLVKSILQDKYLQALMLSAYAHTLGPICTDPFNVYSAFISSVTILLPDRPLMDISRPYQLKSFYHTKGRLLYRLHQALRKRKASPTEATLLLGSLFAVLDVPFRLCTVWGDPTATPDVPWETRKAILASQLSHNPKKTIAPWKLPRQPPPIIWLEVFWTETQSWMAVEMYSGNFNIAGQVRGQPDEGPGKKLSSAQLRPTWLRRNLADISKHVEPQFLVTTSHTKTTQKQPDAEGLEAGLFLMGESSDDDEEEEEVRPAAQLELKVVGEFDKVLAREASDEALSMHLNLADLTEESPFQFFNKKDAKGHEQKVMFLQKHLKVALSCDIDLQIRDVTFRYLPVLRTNQFKPFRAMMKYLTKILYPDDLQRTRWSHYDALDEVYLARTRATLQIPTSLGDFRDHQVYALESMLKPTQVLMANRGNPVGFRKGEPIWLRVHVRELATERAWFKKGRKVKLNENPYKVVTKKLRQRGAQEHHPVEVPLFILEQTDMMTEEEYSRALETAPGYFVVKRSLLPPGWVHLKESVLPGVTRAARQLKVDYKIAIVNFEYSKGDYKSVKDGVIVSGDYEDSVMEKQKVIQSYLDRSEAYERRMKAIGWWRVLFKMILATAKREG